MKLKDLKDIDKDDLLRFVGLQTKRTLAEWMLPTIGLFALGMLVGAGVALLIAPKSEREPREDLRDRAQGANEDVVRSFSGGAAPGAERTPRAF